jgi:hypothetical protein
VCICWSCRCDALQVKVTCEVVQDVGIGLSSVKEIKCQAFATAIAVVKGASSSGEIVESVIVVTGADEEDGKASC